MKILIVFLIICLITAINPIVGLIVGLLTLAIFLCYSGVTLIIDFLNMIAVSNQNSITDIEEEFRKIAQKLETCTNEQDKELLEAKLKYLSLKMKRKE